MLQKVSKEIIETEQKIILALVPHFKGCCKVRHYCSVNQLYVEIVWSLRSVLKFFKDLTCFKSEVRSFQYVSALYEIIFLPYEIYHMTYDI